MKQELLLGAAYYPEYMPYDRIEKDLEMMKKAGMNVIRIAESTWSTLEPEPGKFNFSYIDAAIWEAEKQNMKVIIGTPTYAIPAWLCKKDGDVMVTTKSGQIKYGHRQKMNLWNPTFRFYAERVIRELMAHTANHPLVIGFQLDNETKHYGNTGKQIQEKFLEYLREKYKTTEELNKAFHLSYWSNSIHSWDDFPDIEGCINGGLCGEFEKFRRTLTAEYLSWQADIVREYKREDQFITHNFDFEWKKFGVDIAQDGYSYGVQPDICHYEASKCLTVSGCDIYHPTQDALTGAEIAFGGDEIRSLKKDNYLVLECQAQAFKYWTPYPGQLRLQAYSHLASGAKGLLYWNWHSIHNGYETYWKGLLSHDLQENPAYEEACVFGQEWKKLGAENLQIKKKNRVALLIDNHTLTAFQWFPVDRDLSYNDIVRWMYDSLYELNIECDVVDVNALDIKEYDMIVTPALYSTGEKLLEQLEEFVKSGGVLVSTFKSFVSDEHFTVWNDTQPHRLFKCFGMSYNQFTEPGSMTLKGEKVKYFAELLKPETAKSLGDYEHKYWGKYAGITENKYGRGFACYIGCYTTKKILKDVLGKAADRAGILKEGTELSFPVIVRSGVNGKEKVLHYILHYSEKERKILCPYKKVRDILTEEIYEKGDILHLEDWAVKILEEME